MTTVTWWGCAAVELALGGIRVAIDPYLKPRQADYVLVTHEHYDHCHEPTLRNLVANPRFRRLIAPKSCLFMSRLDSPVGAQPSDLSFVPRSQLTVMYPKYTKERTPQYPEPRELTLDHLTVEAIDSSERPIRYKAHNNSKWHEPPGAWVGKTEFPTLGYVITDNRAGLTFYHPGDLREAFDSQRILRGRVDYMFLPLGKTEGIVQTLVDNVRPRYVIPMHYRLDEPSFPIPLDIKPEEVCAADFFTGEPVPGADDIVFAYDIQRMIEAHWYPTPENPMDDIEPLGAVLDGLSDVLVLEAGRPVEITA